MPENSQYLVDCCTSNGLLVSLMTIFQAEKAEKCPYHAAATKSYQRYIIFLG